MNQIKETFHEDCGIVGVYGHPDAANLTYLGLYALQHRGQEASGIVTYDNEGKIFRQKKGQGLVADVFNPQTLSLLTGSSAIGHNRYSTAGDSVLDNAQPLMGSFSQGTRLGAAPIAIAHN
jgi:amidophosphoribosyltransferase